MDAISHTDKWKALKFPVKYLREIILLSTGFFFT